MSNDIQTIVHTKSGASCRVHPFGATVVSYKSADGRENLFVSRDSKLDGSKAIRGGIPLVFPIFGPTGTSMPQHGFARNNTWKVKPDSMYDHDEVAGITYTLDLADVTAGRGTDNPWSVEQCKLDGTDCALEYEIIVGPNTLTCTLMVTNTGKSAFNFQMLLHTYLAVDNRAAQSKPNECYVHGLGGYSIIDKVDASKSGKAQSYDDDIVLEGETDRVYIHPEKHSTVTVKVGVGGTKTIKMEANGQVDESPTSTNCVVWNPGKEKAAGMSDFGDDQYQDMICVEPGLIGHQPLLPPGTVGRMTQIIFVG